MQGARSVSACRCEAKWMEDNIPLKNEYGTEVADPTRQQADQAAGQLLVCNRSHP